MKMVWGYEVEKKVLSKNNVHLRENMVGEEDGHMEMPEEEETAFEIMN